MSSSDGTGAVRRAVAEGRQIAEASAAAGDEDGQPDPWFAPGPKVASTEPDAAEATDADGQAVRFLPAGRAGLLPGSITESWDDGNGAAADRTGRTEAAGAPPWGRDSASAAADEPPPWETGPWPGPGEAAVRRPEVTAADRRAGDRRAADLDRGRERPQRSRLIIGFGAAAVLAVVAIVVIVMTLSGGPSAGCATYPAPVRQAYTRAMSDLGGHASPSVQAADLERAASLANASAAAAGQITARTALFAMANDLDSAYTDVTKNRPVTSALLQQLTADGTALPGSCPS
jgi:hypothetical protein